MPATTTPPPMTIELQARTDGAVVLRCVRADGSVSWQKQAGARARFFAIHDLTHYALETTLAVPNAFFGLVAAGWPIDDTTGKTARGPIPVEAVAVEHLVSMLDRERNSGDVWSAATICEQVALYAAEHGLPIDAWPPLTDALLTRVRATAADLAARWQATPPGGTLALRFPPEGP